MEQDIDDFLPDDYHQHCNKCGCELPSGSFSDMLDAEVKFRSFFPRTWAHMPRIILCPPCYHEERRNNPPPAWA